MGADFILKYLIANKPEYWEELEIKYDPEGTYKKKYESSLSDVTEATVQ